jgi:ElaB/YqjD/DUF883 family membrane-anchored ribosome-binding protein
VDTTANPGERADPRTIKRAAREAAHQAGAAAGEEMQNLLADVDDLINRVGDAADPEVRRLRSKVAAAVAATRQSIADGTEQVQRQAKQALEASDRYVHNQPWEAIGIAALAGIAVGFLVSRR